MDILVLQHEDFFLTVRSSNLQKAFEKAKIRHRDFYSVTQYRSTTGVLSLIDKELQVLEPLQTEKAHPIFFENKDYHVSVSFTRGTQIGEAHIYSRLKEVQDKFFFEEKHAYLSGTINFGNDLGRSDLTLRYRKDGESRECSLSFEVFPTKLDYRKDYEQIIADIEEQYPLLVLDFLKKTYSTFQSGSSANTDLIWWQVFGRLYKDFIKASRFVLNKPHSRIVRNSRHVRADRVSRWTPKLEERFGELGHLPHALYYEDRKTLSSDTSENRFFKFALQQTARRYKTVKTYIQKTFGKSLSDDFLVELASIEKDLNILATNPFLRQISEFRGLRQESLVLQKATGYSSVYKCWLMLNTGLRFLSGVQRIELKNIAELYQIWCFLTMKSVLQKLLGDEPEQVNLAEIQVDDFIFRIARGVHSKVSFRLPNGNLVDLYHDLSYKKQKGEDGLRTFTVEQRPDIVLRITKTDLRDNYALTYLYDAKYRLRSDERDDSPDLPEEDAINQMHRYRDAIYYVEMGDNRPQKEVLGTYVLFPGKGEIEEIRASEYMRSIAEVNIGAFPLVPGKDETRLFLTEHLEHVLGLTTEDALEGIAPQKQSSYESVNPEVLIGLVPSMEHAACFRRDVDRFYYTGAVKPTRFGYKDLRYFAPYIAGSGVQEYYEITGYELVERNRIADAPEGRNGAGDSSERLVLHLGRRYRISLDDEFLKLSDGSIRHFRYTNLFNIRNPVDGKITVLVVTSRNIN